MKKVLIIILSIIQFSISAQSIVDIEIDEIYLKSEDIYFINNGVNNTYKCELMSTKIRDFENSIFLDCDMDNKVLTNKGIKKLKFEDLKVYNRSEDLIKDFKEHKYGLESNKESENKAYLQYFNNHLIAEIWLKNQESDSQLSDIKNVDFWNFIFLRINGKHLFIALIDEDSDVTGLVIPLKERLLILFDEAYYEQGPIIDPSAFENYLRLNQYYWPRKDSVGVHLSNFHFRHNLFDQSFDQIKIGDRYVIFNDKQGVKVFNKLFEQLPYDNITEAYEAFGSIQCIVENQIKWIDGLGIMHDTFPKPQWGLCGTINYYRRRIFNDSVFFYENFEKGMFNEKSIRDSITLANVDDVKSIRYLTNKTDHNYDEYSDLEAVFSFPYTYYVFDQSNIRQLVSLVNKRDSIAIAMEFSQAYVMGSQKQRADIRAEIDKLENDIEIKPIFKGNLETFGYYHPIKFSEGNLYGYYPQNKKARYKSIEKFNYHFAKFELENGQQGWLDINGNEYFIETKAHNK